MKKLLVGFICTLFLTINVTTGEAAKLEPDETLVELGGSFDAKASAKGAIPEEVDGKSGSVSYTHLTLSFHKNTLKIEFLKLFIITKKIKVKV